MKKQEELGLKIVIPANFFCLVFMYYLNSDFKIFRIACMLIIAASFGIIGFLIGSERKQPLQTTLPTWFLKSTIPLMYAGGAATLGMLAWHYPERPLVAFVLLATALSVLVTGIMHGALTTVFESTPEKPAPTKLNLER